MRYAYVVGVFNTKTGEFMGAGVFSEETPTLGGNRFPVTMLTGRGKDYTEAFANLQRQLAEPSMEWLARHIVARAPATERNGS